MQVLDKLVQPHSTVVIMSHYLQRDEKNDVVTGRELNQELR